MSAHTQEPCRNMAHLVAWIVKPRSSINRWIGWYALDSQRNWIRGNCTQRSSDAL
jgi:hypothetical protein